MWQCPNCNYLHDPNAGLAPDPEFEELPDNWICPQCATPKDKFVQLGSNDDE